jgi:magnesium-protoporphyrin O-methyltransferase
VPSQWPRRFCCDEELAFIGYDGRDASKDLASWRRRGPRRTTTELIDVIRANGVEGATVLDIGAGVGVVHTSLLEAGAAAAVDVDASPEYLAAARAEAERRGLAGRVDYRYGDVVELADELPAADIVTLDAVVCCYPYLDALLAAATRSRPRLVGLTYPRDVWWMLLFMGLYNAAHSVRRSPARYFAYRHRQVRALMSDAGYEEIYDGGSVYWRVGAYRRGNGDRPSDVEAGVDPLRKGAADPGHGGNFVDGRAAHLAGRAEDAQ